MDGFVKFHISTYHSSQQKPSHFCVVQKSFLTSPISLLSSLNIREFRPFVLMKFTILTTSVKTTIKEGGNV